MTSNSLVNRRDGANEPQKVLLIMRNPAPIQIISSSQARALQQVSHVAASQMQARTQAHAPPPPPSGWCIECLSFGEAHVFAWGVPQEALLKSHQGAVVVVEQPPTAGL